MFSGGRSFKQLQEQRYGLADCRWRNRSTDGHERSIMRELVYLSQRKLAQFQDEKPRGGILSRVTSFGAKAPLSMGEMNVSLAPASPKAFAELQRVIDALDLRSRGVQWYAAPGVQVGDWVQFEVSLNFAIATIPGRTSAEPLVFWEPRRAGQPASPELLLHGSVDGLVEGRRSAGDASTLAGVLSDPRELLSAVRSLARLEDSDERTGGNDTVFWRRIVLRFVNRLRSKYPDFTASWCAGHARVTAILPSLDETDGGLILASPLYVERTSDPALASD